MVEPREQGWLQKIIEDADKRVNAWPEWKKDLAREYGSSCKGHAPVEESTDSDASETKSQSQGAHG